MNNPNEPRRLSRQNVDYHPDISDEDKELVQDAIMADVFDAAEHFDLQPIPPELQNLVTLADSLVEIEMHALGIDEADIEQLNGKRAYFIDASQKRHRDSTGQYSNVLDATLLFPEMLKRPRWQQLFILLHERVHHHTQQMQRYRPTKDGVHIYANAASLGYGYKKRDETGPQEQSYFTGVTEAITERIALKILFAYAEQDSSLVPHSDEKFERMQQDYAADVINNPIQASEYYHDFIKILNTIFDAIAAEEGRTREDVWSTWERGLFVRERMHMRKVDHVYGPGSLRFLAAMYSGGRKNNMNIENDISATVAYFSTRDHAEHAAIAKTALRGLERKAWLKANGYFKDKA